MYGLTPLSDTILIHLQHTKGPIPVRELTALYDMLKVKNSFFFCHRDRLQLVRREELDSAPLHTTLSCSLVSKELINLMYLGLEFTYSFSTLKM